MLTNILTSVKKRKSLPSLKKGTKLSCSLNTNIFLWLNRYNYLMSRIKEGGVHFNGANTLSAHQCEAAKRIIMPLLSKGKVNNTFNYVLDSIAYLHCRKRALIPIRVQRSVPKMGKVMIRDLDQNLSPSLCNGNNFCTVQCSHQA